MTQQSWKTIVVEKSLHMKHAFVSCMAYTSLTKPILIEHVWSEYDGAGDWEQGKLLKRRSTDNGGTWETVGEASYEKKAGDRVVRTTQPVYHLDPGNGRLAEFFTEYESWARTDAANFGSDAESDYLPFRTGRIFYRLSGDEGRSWGSVRQLIQKGRSYNGVHWAEGIRYEKNAGTFCELNRVARLADGTILLPISLTLLDEEGRMVKWPDRFGDEIWAVEACATLRGRWRKDQNDFDWEISNTVTVPEYMSRGLCEPAVVEVADGNLMMVMRGSSSARQALPGVKFFSISKDGGKSWGPAVPLTYPDASYVHSPGSLPNLFRSSKNGRIYLIANILPQVCRHGDPRYPLAIAEIDPKYYWVLPETVTVIADREKRHSNRVRFSNWQRIEDRETGNPVIFMTEARADDIIPGTPGRHVPHSYRYDIKLPD